jgi:signal transduction histidine kinase
MELDKFVYSVSHDLRAPLLSMKGVVDITWEESSDAMIVENMKMLSGSINRLDNFIGEILEFSRNARTDVKKDVIDFRELIAGIMPELQALNSASNPVKIQTEVKGKGILCSDRSRVGVILHNLAVNAIQYHDTGAANPYVKIQVSVNDKEALIEVEDNGIGIREEYHARIFDMFSRFSENSIGAGLGLYNVKEALDKLNGHITVASAPDKGTKMSLRIPNLFYQ